MQLIVEFAFFDDFIISTQFTHSSQQKVTSPLAIKSQNCSQAEVRCIFQVKGAPPGLDIRI
jgi:hypothetical protein